MFNFILSMWMMHKVTAEKVQSYAPKYINQAQANDILATPQLIQDEFEAQAASKA